MCFDCYHCVAACPHEAFTHKNAAPAQCLPIREEWRTRMNKPLLLLLALTAVASARPPLIVTGWDSPSPAQYRQHLAEFERWGVFDGTTIRPTRRMANGRDVDSRFTFSREPWRWEEFAGALADLRAAKPTTCRETFLMLYANPGNVDWFDDTAWREVVDHWRLLARLAKQGGLRGLLYDAEPYVKPHAQFRYGAQAQAAKHTFAEYQSKARERGREVMRALAAEFPEATIFTYRLFSDLLPLLDAGDLNRALEPDTYGLQPAFVDGWMDAAPATITIIEGTEDIGYRANSPAEYNAAFTRQRLRLAEFLSPEHREKFARQLRIGQSLYLDAHVNPPGHAWTIDRTDSTPARRLAANLAAALAASDGLVWLYGEQARWWPGGDAKSQTWAQKLPGAVTAIRRAKDPAAFVRSLFEGQRARTNLLANADFARTDGKAPAGWFTWQDDDSHGTFACTNGCAIIRGAKQAVVGMGVKTEPSAVLAVRLRVKTTGRGLAALSIGWKTADGKWTAHARNARFVPSAPPAADGWQEIHGLVEVPAGAGQLMFMAAASGQAGESDACSFKTALLTPVLTDE